MKIGIFGGTFDPIHNGHLHVIEQSLKYFKLDFLYIVPNNQSPFKNKPMFSKEERLNKIFEKTKPFKEKIIIDDEQILNDKISYSIDYINNIYDVDNDFYYIMGSDALLEFDKYYKWEEILSKVELIVIERVGYNSDLFLKRYPHYVKKIHHYKDNSFFPSSTMIRENFKKGEML